MVCDENGDVYISGQLLEDAGFWGEDTLFKTGIGPDGFIARVSSEGDLAWCFNLTSLPMGEGTVTELAWHNNNLYIAYSTWINTYVLIFSEDGMYLDSVMQEDVGIISSLDFNPDGGLITAGSCAGWDAMFGGVPYPAPFSYTTYLVSYNSDHEPEWVKYIEDVTCTFPQVKAGDDGWIYFAGQLWTGTLFDTIQANGPEWVNDFFLARLSPEGIFQWVAECPQVMTGDATVGSQQFLDTDAEGNALLTGTTRGIMDWGNGVMTDVTDHYQDIIIWNYGPDSQVNWVKTAGGEGYEQSGTISAGNDGSSYIAGVISGNVQFDSINYETIGYVDPFLTRLDAGIISATPGNAVPDDFLVYPNPASDRIFIRTEPGYEVYRLYNCSGSMVCSGNLSGLKTGISLIDLPESLYLLEIEGVTRPAAFAKVIVR
jgi:hypothetical protein